MVLSLQDIRETNEGISCDLKRGSRVNPRMKSQERAPELALLESLFKVIHRGKGTT